MAVHGCIAESVSVPLARRCGGGLHPEFSLKLLLLRFWFFLLLLENASFIIIRVSYIFGLKSGWPEWCQYLMAIHIRSTVAVAVDMFCHNNGFFSITRAYLFETCDNFIWLCWWIAQSMYSRHGLRRLPKCYQGLVSGFSTVWISCVYNFWKGDKYFLVHTCH